MADYARHVPSVSRAVDLLEAIATTDDGMAAGALEAVVDGSRSGLFALLNTLRGRDWLVQDDAGAYRVGPGLRRLVPRDDHDDRGLGRALADAVEEMAPDESVALVRPDGADRLVIAVHDGVHAVRCVHRVGQARSGPGADGAALATVTTRTDPDDDDAGTAVDVAGVSVHDDEAFVEVAAPVCRDGRRPVAAVVAAVPRQRADAAHLEDVATTVRALATEVSLRLGAPDWQPWGLAVDAPVGPRRVLDDDEVTDVLAGRHRAQLACLRDDGTPHVVPLWFLWDGASLWLTASPGAAWAEHVGAGGRVSLTIEEPHHDLRRVFVTGWASPVDDATVADQVPGGLTGLRQLLLDRYVGHESTAPVPDAAGWTAIRVVPERIQGRAGLGRAVA